MRPLLDQHLLTWPSIASTTKETNFPNTEHSRITSSVEMYARAMLLSSYASHVTHQLQSSLSFLKALTTHRAAHQHACVTQSHQSGQPLKDWMTVLHYLSLQGFHCHPMMCFCRLHRNRSHPTTLEICWGSSQASKHHLIQKSITLSMGKGELSTTVREPTQQARVLAMSRATCTTALTGTTVYAPQWHVTKLKKTTLASVQRLASAATISIVSQV